VFREAAQLPRVTIPLFQRLTQSAATRLENFTTSGRSRSENIDGLTDIHEGKDPGSKAIAGWAYDFGKGRVVFTAVGHTLHALWQTEYFKLQKNAVRWLLRMA
jgi:hypothetical protein